MVISFRKNRKRSGMVLTGVVLSSSVVNAMNQGVARAVPQNDLKSFTGKGVEKRDGVVIKNFLKNNWLPVLLVALGLITIAIVAIYVADKEVSAQDILNAYDSKNNMVDVGEENRRK